MARFVIEAESYSGRIQGAQGSWWQVNGTDGRFLEGPMTGTVAPNAQNGARGNYMEVIGNSLPLDPTSTAYTGALLEYKVRVEKAGDYTLYVRWTGRNIFTDSLYAFILGPDGTLLISQGLRFFLYHGRVTWIWENIGRENLVSSGFAGRGDTAIWRLLQSGDYSIRIAQREEESALDALVFQTTNLPSPRGANLPPSQIAPQVVRVPTLEPFSLLLLALFLTAASWYFLGASKTGA